MITSELIPFLSLPPSPFAVVCKARRLDHGVVSVYFKRCCWPSDDEVSNDQRILALPSRLQVFGAISEWRPGSRVEIEFKVLLRVTRPLTLHVILVPSGNTSRTLQTRAVPIS